MYLSSWAADKKISPPKTHNGSKAPAKMQVTPDVTRPSSITEKFAWEMCRHCATHHKVLLPNAGDTAIRRALRRVWGTENWMIEEDPVRYKRIVMEYMAMPKEHPADVNYDLDLMWRMPFVEWANQYDPEPPQIDMAILNSAPNYATPELKAAWEFVKLHGLINAILPWKNIYHDRQMHDWLEERWAQIEPLSLSDYDPAYHVLNLQWVGVTRCVSLDTGELL